MKLHILFILCLLAIGTISCTAQDENDDTKTSKEMMKKMKNARNISFFDTDIKLKKGEVIGFSYSEHGSVGETSEFSVDDPSIIAHLTTTEKYKNPEKMKAGMSGADELSGMYYFEAVQEGQTEITMRDYFRGDLKNKMVYKITVEGDDEQMAIEEDVESMLIDPLKTEWTVKKGGVLFFPIEEHGSVGERTAYEIEDGTGVLEFVKKEMDKKEPADPDKPTRTGGDSSKGMYYFKATKAGTSTLIIKSVFRGKTKSETRYNFTIE